MKSAPILVAAAAAGVLTFITTRPAHALGPVDLEIGAKAGVATNPSTGGGDNPMGFGVGGRAGISVLGFYGGGQIMYYFGSSQTVDSVSYSSHTLMYGVEGGYGFSVPVVGLLTIRPQVGIGNATFTESGGGVSDSKSNLYVEPGVTVLLSFFGWYVGADANLLVFPGLDNSQIAVTIHGQVGLKF